MTVSFLYIAQVKQKYGIIERENYNKTKSEDAGQPKCPEDKEKAIADALRYFQRVSSGECRRCNELKQRIYDAPLRQTDGKGRRVYLREIHEDCAANVGNEAISDDGASSENTCNSCHTVTDDQERT